MAITEAAQRNHDQLFPGHVSTLKVSDPELIEIFDNWAFGEVVEAAGMDIRLRLMVQLAALIACQAVGEYRAMLDGALNVGVTPVEVKEIVYQAVPYAGMGTVFDFIHATNDVFRNRGIEPGSGVLTSSAERSRRSGVALTSRQQIAVEIVNMSASGIDRSQLRPHLLAERRERIRFDAVLSSEPANVEQPSLDLLQSARIEG